MNGKLVHPLHETSFLFSKTYIITGSDRIQAFKRKQLPSRLEDAQPLAMLTEFIA